MTNSFPNPPDELCAHIAGLFRDCSAELSGKKMALYPSSLLEKVRYFCRWRPSYQTIRETELGQNFFSIDLMQEMKSMNGEASYAACTVATLLFMQANHHVSEIIAPFGPLATQQPDARFSLSFCLELPYAVQRMPKTRIFNFFTGAPIEHDEILRFQPPDVEHFMSRIPCELDRVWGAKGNPAARPEVTRQQRDFFVALYHHYAR
jgi:hypothetical protein